MTRKRTRHVVACPDCGAIVRQDNMKDHYRHKRAREEGHEADPVFRDLRPVPPPGTRGIQQAFAWVAASSSAQGNSAVASTSPQVAVPTATPPPHTHTHTHTHTHKPPACASCSSTGLSTCTGGSSTSAQDAASVGRLLHVLTTGRPEDLKTLVSLHAKEIAVAILSAGDQDSTRRTTSEDINKAVEAILGPEIRTPQQKGNGNSASLHTKAVDLESLIAEFGYFELSTDESGESKVRCPCCSLAHKEGKEITLSSVNPHKGGES